MDIFMRYSSPREAATSSPAGFHQQQEGNVVESTNGFLLPKAYSLEYQDPAQATIAIGWANGRPTEVRLLHYQASSEATDSQFHSSPTVSAMPLKLTGHLRPSSSHLQGEAAAATANTTVVPRGIAVRTGPRAGGPGPRAGPSRKHLLFRSLSDLVTRLRGLSTTESGVGGRRRASTSAVLRVVDGRLVYGTAAAESDVVGGVHGPSPFGEPTIVAPNYLDISETEDADL